MNIQETDRNSSMYGGAGTKSNVSLNIMTGVIAAGSKPGQLGYTNQSINNMVKPTKYGMFAYLQKLKKDVDQATDPNRSQSGGRPFTGKTGLSAFNSNMKSQYEFHHMKNVAFDEEPSESTNPMYM